ncbi:ABC transporter permease [Actinophytocola sp.]|uniref:ABC transporter permease n=1 Tax=Actinophytocola sp. TaxID=1872138 RepID=UPI002ED60C30
MVWVMWRQHRAQVLATVGLLLLLEVYLLVAGQDAAVVLGWLPIAPLLIGIFWGAPLLARELERGTHRLAWTQSVTRQRWLLSKLGGLSLVVTVAGLALGLMVSTWVTAHDADRFGDTALFGGSGVVAGAWWLFAFLLGSAAGGLLRRLLPALALTIVVFLVMLFAMVQSRGNFAEPLRSLDDYPAAGTLGTAATWLAPSGEEVDTPPVCLDASRLTYLGCVEDAGYRSVYYYQPADRYWRFQWTETGILLLCTVLLAGPVVYRVLRRPV